jgi:hypothetical protein
MLQSQRPSIVDSGAGEVLETLFEGDLSQAVDVVLGDLAEPRERPRKS